MNDPAWWREQGKRHLAEGRPAEAHACLAQSAVLRPEDDAIRADLAQSLYLSGRAEEAIALYRDLVAREPDNLSYAIDLGRAQRAIGAYADALKTYLRVLESMPREAVVLNNIGNCLLALGQTDAAIASLRRATEARPDFIDPHYNLGLALLTAGQMREGWEEYRWRLRLSAHWIDGRPISEWDGTAMPGKVLFVRCEQGLGDTIQFCRYVSMIAPRARVVLGVPRELQRLMSQLPRIERVITDGDPAPAHDAECVLMSLPRLLGAYDAGSAPYLRADPTAWRSRLAALPGPKIGLVWAGSSGAGTINLADRRRSLPLAALAPLRGPTFISLQKGPAAIQAQRPPEGMVLIDWTNELEDFADTASLIAALDLVISVDTAVAHLAGALGRPVWLLNRADTDWRWGVSGETSPWYPTMRIFRQRSHGDWTTPIAAIADASRQPRAISDVLTLAAADISFGLPNDAEARLRQTLLDRPDDPDIGLVHAALGRCLLLSDRWAEAWPEWALSQRASPWPTPRWDGSAMAGETLLLHADTVEDVLLFGRFVGATIARSKARVVLSVPPNMQRLMIGWMDAAVATAARPSHHRHCPFALLPVLFRARPNTVPDIDLCPPPPLPVIEAWSPNVTRLRGLRVGVAFDDPSLLNAIAQLPGVNLVALTGGPWVADPVHDWSAGFDDTTTVAGLIVHLDLVIAADNEIAHLAGALGRPVWLISPKTPHWPWIPGREDNPWYPTSRQFPPGSAAAITTELARMATDTPEDQTFDYGNDRHRRGDYRAAATGFRQTLALKPDHAGALGNLAITMLTLGRPEIAVRYAEQAVRVAPASQPLRYRLGLALHACGRFYEAVARLREAHAMEPTHTDTLTALGNAQGAAGALQDAIGTLRETVASRPDNAGYHTNLAYALLRAGQWDEGWLEHEYRSERPRIGKTWNGQALSGAPLIIRHEQGLGDIIQFCRYVPLAAERAGGQVFLTGPPPLRDLLRSLRGVSILTPDDPIPENAHQFPLLSLPLLFGPEIPAEVPYLHADPLLTIRWRDRIAALPGLRIGLVWAGNRRLGTASLAVTDRRRSLPEGTLAPFATVPGVTFVSLQVGDAVPPGVVTVDWTADLTDFAQTAALIASLDLVISVDTAVAHLAGALGRPVWLLNRFDTDWRWMDGRDDSPWYPTMRLFRQTSPGDWNLVIDRVAHALNAMTGGGNI